MSEKLIALENLARQAEGSDKEERAEAEKLSPDYESGDDIKKRCHEKAIVIIGVFDGLVKKVKPDAASHVLNEAMLHKGVSKVEAVLLKYPDAEVPPWLSRILKYQEEFEAGMFFAGALYGIYQVDKAMQAAAAEAEETDGDTPPPPPPPPKPKAARKKAVKPKPKNKGVKK